MSEQLPPSGTTNRGALVLVATPIGNLGDISQRAIEAPLFIDSCRWIHTFGVKCTLDVAYLDEQMQVIKVQKIKPRRVGMPVLKAKHVLEAGAGTFENWGLVIGHTLEARST